MLQLMLRTLRPVYLAMALLSFLMSMPLDYAAAALVETQSCSQPDVDSVRSRLMLILAREEVQAALVRHGVDLSEAQARVATLTGSEIREIQNFIRTLPAGGGGEIVVFPLAVVILILIGYVLVISGIITLGAYAGVKASEAQEQEDRSTKPYPAPPRTGTAPAFNLEEPWTGTWRVTEGRTARFYVLKQTGEKVVSTPLSDYSLEAKSYGAVIRGAWFDKVTRPFTGDFKAIMADDYLSFKGEINSRNPFTGERVEFKSTAMSGPVSGPWAGKWQVQGAPFASGLWVLQQDGASVLSTGGSYHRIRGTATADRLDGEIMLIGRSDYKLRLTLSVEGTSFDGILNDGRAGEWPIKGTKID